MSLYKDVMNLLLLSESELNSYLHTVPFRYKRYTISKRNSEELRQIAQPAKAVKRLQVLAINTLKNHVPVHSVAMAYTEGRGIKQNAMLHLNSRYMVKLDLKHFFDSITPKIFFSVLEKHGLEFSSQDKFLISNLFFWKLRRNSPLRLSIGAPSSPFISNAIMYFFDRDLANYCKENRIRYSRYADDLTFSTNEKNVLKDTEKEVKKILRAHFGSCIRLNKEKTVHTSKAYNRHVTGVTLSSENKLSLGRERKRSIRVSVYKFCNDELNVQDILKLKGYLGFAKHIEPTFVQSLEKRYGSDAIKEIQKYEK